jgi:RimJ/RimL family protein N-acetyltransferase
MDIYAPNCLNRSLFYHIVWYLFENLKVKKVFGFVDSRNVKHQRLLAKLGVKEETRMKDYFAQGIDKIIYSAMRNDVERWIKLVKED